MRIVAFALMFGALGLLTGCGNSASSDDSSRFQGSWSVVKVEYPAEFPDKAKAETDEGIKETVVTFDGDSIVGSIPKKAGAEEKDILKGKIKLDGTKSPRNIDITGTAEGKAEPTTFPAIYKFEGDTLIVAIAMGKDGPGPRPTEFKAMVEKKDTPDARMVILVHLKKK